MSGERRGNMDKIKKLEALIKHLEEALEESQRLLKEIEEEDREQRTVTEAPAAIIVDDTMWKLDPRTGYYVSASGKIGVYEHNKMTLMKRYVSSDGYMTIRPTKKTYRIPPMVARAWIDPKYHEKGFVVKFNDNNTLNCSVNNIDIIQRNENNDDSKNMTRLSAFEVSRICTVLVALDGDVANTFRYVRTHVRKGIAYQTIVNIRDKKRHEEISDKFFYMTSNDILIPVIQMPEKTKERIKRYVEEVIYKELVELRK